MSPSILGEVSRPEADAPDRDGAGGRSSIDRFWAARASLLRTVLALTLTLAAALVGVGLWVALEASRIAGGGVIAAVGLTAALGSAGALLYGYLQERSNQIRRFQRWVEGSSGVDASHRVFLLATELPQWEEDVDRLWRGVLLLAAFVGFGEVGPLCGVAGAVAASPTGPAGTLAAVLVGYFAGSLGTIVTFVVRSGRTRATARSAGQAIRGEAGAARTPPPVPRGTREGAPTEGPDSTAPIDRFYDVLERGQLQTRSEYVRARTWVAVLVPILVGLLLLGPTAVAVAGAGVPTAALYAVGLVVSVTAGLLVGLASRALSRLRHPYGAIPPLPGGPSPDLLARTVRTIESSSRSLAQTRSMAGLVAAMLVLVGIGTAEALSAALNSIAPAGAGGAGLSVLLFAPIVPAFVIGALLYWLHATRAADREEGELRERARALAHLTDEFWARF
jgi:hypothetical protein